MAQAQTNTNDLNRVITAQKSSLCISFWETPETFQASHKTQQTIPLLSTCNNVGNTFGHKQEIKPHQESSNTTHDPVQSQARRDARRYIYIYFTEPLRASQSITKPHRVPHSPREPQRVSQSSAEPHRATQPKPQANSGKSCITRILPPESFQRRADKPRIISNAQILLPKPFQRYADRIRIK